MALMTGGPAHAGQPGSIDPSFQPTLTNAGVWAIRLQPDQKIVVASSYGIHRLRPDGSADPEFQPFSFSSYAPACLALQPDGRILFGGGSSVIAGGVGRLNTNGTLDPTFKLGTGANGTVFNLALLLGNQILVAGDFTTFNGSEHLGLARLFSEGTLDPSFLVSPGGPGGIRALDVQPDGRVLAAGVWLRGSGGPDRGLIRLLSNGTVDTGFAPESTGDSAWLDAVTTQRDGGLLVGGYGIGVAGVYRPIARFQTNGQADLTFPRGDPPSDNPDVRAIIEQENGQIVVGGNFTGLQGVRRPWLVRLHSSGSVDDQFVAGAMDQPVLALAIQADGMILAGGLFSTVNGEPRPGLVRLNPTGDPFGGQFEFSTEWVEGMESSGQVTLTVNRLFSTVGTVTVHAQTVNRDALAGISYVATNTTLTFGPGQDSQTLTVQLINDSTFRGGSFEVQLSDPSANSVLGTPNRTAVSLRDDDTTVEFSSPSYSVREHVPNQLAEVRVVRRTGSFGVSRVNYSTADLTAQAGFDYEPISGTLEFQNFETEKFLNVRVYADERPQGNKSFQLRLSNPSGTLPTTLGETTLTEVTILDDNGPGGVDSTFQIGYGADGGVTRVALGLDGAILLHGGFLNVNQTPCPAFARIRSNGSVEADFPPNRPWFQAQADEALDVEADGSVLMRSGPLYRIRPQGIVELVRPLDSMIRGRLVVQPDQKFLWVGTYSPPGGALQQQFVRFHPEGTLDAEFTAATDPEDTIQDFILQPDGRILVGGQFKKFAGTPRAHWLRLESTGALDPSFPSGSGPNGQVEALALQPDGRIVLAGAFTQVDGQVRPHVARVEPNGTVDPSFSASLWAPETSLASGEDFSRIRVGGDGKIVASGSFTFIWPPGSLNVRDRYAGLVRLHSDGSLDTNFLQAIEGAGFTANVRDFGFQADGKIIVGGRFDWINAYPRLNFARLNNDPGVGAGQFSFVATNLVVSESAGTVNLTVRRTGGSRGAILVGYGARGSARPGYDYELPGTWVRFEDGDTQDKSINVRILNNQLGEENRTFQITLGNVIGGGVLAHPAVAEVTVLEDDVSLSFLHVEDRVLEGDGRIRIGVQRTGSILPAVSVQYSTRDREARSGQDYVPTAGALNFAANVTSQYLEVATLTNSWGEGDRDFEILLSNPGGGATLGEPSVQRVLIVDDDRPGSLDSAYNSGANPLPGTLSLQVLALTLQRDGRLLAAGEISLGGNTIEGLSRLNQDGSPDPQFGTDGIAIVPVWPQALAVQSDGRILVGGGNTLSAGSLIRLRANGSNDTSFPAQDLGFVTTLNVLEDDRILAAGQIVRDTSLLGVVRLSSSGVLDPSFARTELELMSGLPGGLVRSLARTPTGDLYVGGEFVRLAGSSRSGLARLNAKGVVDPSFAPVLGLTEPSSAPPAVSALLVQSGGRILISGRFTRVNGVARGGLARLKADGSLDSTFNAELSLPAAPHPLDPSPVGYAVALLEDVDGRLIVAGNFSRANGERRLGLARLQPDGSLDRFYDSRAGVTSWLSPGGWGAAAIAAVVREESGQLLVGGNFEEFNGQPRIALARLNGGLALSLISLEMAEGGSVRLQADIPQTATYVLQASPDLRQWSDRQSQLLDLGRHELIDPGEIGSPGQLYYRLKPR